MATRRVATVFGGSGFIGRYVVKRLAQQGYVVRVAVRDPEARLVPEADGCGGTGRAALCIGDERADGASRDRRRRCGGQPGGRADRKREGHLPGGSCRGGERIARIAAATGVERLIQISAIGADPDSPSRYAATKGQAEQAVLAAFPGATILRPSLVFGLEDKFFNRFAELGRLLPFMPVIAGETKMQPVYVCDVADAVMAALASRSTEGKIFELGGPRVWTFREILAFILKQTRRNRRLLDIPMGVARFQASILQHVPGKPLTPDQLLMLAKDNVVAPRAAGLTDLGITPTPVELIVPAYLSRFQPGGGRRPTEPLPQER